MRFTCKFITFLCLIALSAGNFNAHAQADTLDMVILGDSNIWLAGDSCDNHKGWVAWFKDFIRPKSMVSYARSGASWSHTDMTKVNTVENTGILGNDNVIYNQVLRLINDYNAGVRGAPDVIFIDAGGNDAWFNDKRPREFDETVEQVMAVSPAALLAKRPNEVLSLAGAIRYDVLKLRTVFPEAKIIFITSTPLAKVEPEMMTRVCDIIERTGMWLGIPTLRLDVDSPISRDVELKEHVNTYDGTHTNETGAERVGQYVAEKIRPLLPTK